MENLEYLLSAFPEDESPPLEPQIPCQDEGLPLFFMEKRAYPSKSSPDSHLLKPRVYPILFSDEPEVGDPEPIDFQGFCLRECEYP